MKKQKGFTLVELLVVIAIIGLLSTIAFISLNRARAKARDSKRISDVRQLQSALELYYNDQVLPGYPRCDLGNGCGQAISSAQLPAQYVAQVPVAPTPPDEAPGGPVDCTDATNRYRYYSWVAQDLAEQCDAVGEICGWYRINFCLGGATGGLQAGLREATPAGML